MVRELSHYIGGRRVDGTSGRYSDVYDPCTGEVQAKVPLAGAEEVRNAVANAEKAQPEWGAMNAQRRGRILLRFVDLVNQNMDELAALLSSEHGKTLADARGDIQRGIEVVEFAAGAPHLLKGEFSDDAGAGIDVHSMRQPLGVVA
uniref:aldehyde dehydrogenase family protein n=3 Tax=Arthrobacter TaxID=1663 RepID=UPI001124F19C